MLNYLIIWKSLCSRCAMPESPGVRSDTRAFRHSGGYMRFLKAISRAGITWTKMETR
jgi:hypothetical protein